MAGFLSALLLTALWLLAPRANQDTAGEGVIELTFMGTTGPVSGALDDAIRQFEEDSRRAHAADPTKPVYRVVSGQNASRNQTDDPTRFLLSVAGGVPPDVIYFDRFAIAEWSARGAFSNLAPFLEKDLANGVKGAIRSEDFYRACWSEVVSPDPLTGKPGVFGIPDRVD